MKTYDSALMSFLPASIVQDELAKRGAKFTKVTFAKKDGTVTTRVGMPKVFARRVGGVKGPAATPQAIKRAATAAKALTDHGNRFFDYAQPKDGKTGFAFNMGRVVAIGEIGQHPDA